VGRVHEAVRSKGGPLIGYVAEVLHSCTFRHPSRSGVPEALVEFVDDLSLGTRSPILSQYMLSTW
jgi:hypothetical protein